MRCCCAWLGPFVDGSRCRQADSACWKSGEPGLSEAETVIVSVPVASGSGKLGIPWERMQAVYLIPAGPVPTCVDILAPNPPLPAGKSLELLLALALPLEGVVSRLATDGAFEPPPQPAAMSARAARAGKISASPPLLSAARRLADPATLRLDPVLNASTLRSRSRIFAHPLLPGSEIEISL